MARKTQPQLQNALHSIGLAEGEARVYLAALRVGSGSVQEIAREADVKRTTAYSIIDQLRERGLMRIELKGFKKRYVAEEPEKLEGLLEQRRNIFQDILPELSALYNLRGGESFIKYYEGLDALKGVYLSLLEDIRPQEDYYVISDQELWYNIDSEFFEGFMKRRAKMNANIRLLLIDKPIAHEYQEKQHVYNETIRILPADTKLTTNMVVIPKKVVVHQLVPPMFAMVIENHSIVQMHQEFFRIMWNSLGPVNKHERESE